MPIYLKLDSVKGGVTMKTHLDEIEVSTVSYGLSRPIAVGGPGGGPEAGRASMTEISVTKTHDGASIPLVRALAKGENLGVARITFVRVSEAPTDYLQVELHDTYVSSVNVSSDGDRPDEHVTLACRQARWTDVSVKDGPTVGFDFASGTMT